MNPGHGWPWWFWPRSLATVTGKRTREEVAKCWDTSDGPSVVANRGAWWWLTEEGCAHGGGRSPVWRRATAPPSSLSGNDALLCEEQNTFEEHFDENGNESETGTNDDPSLRKKVAIFTRSRKT